MSQLAAEDLTAGANCKIVISCLSGRGRSGTLAAIVAGFALRKYPHLYNAMTGRIERVSVSAAISAVSFPVPAYFSYEADDSPLLKDGLSIDKLVNVIVQMRSNRDGLVELPAQFSYVRKILGL